MKKIILTALFIGVCATIVYGEYENCVPRTATIDSLTLNSIRNASHPNSNHDGYDVVMRKYWCDYISITDTLFIENFPIYERFNGFNTFEYTKEALWGAIGDRIT